jgi:hypothetical protein
VKQDITNPWRKPAVPIRTRNGPRNSFRSISLPHVPKFSETLRGHFYELIFCAIKNLPTESTLVTSPRRASYSVGTTVPIPFN